MAAFLLSGCMLGMALPSHAAAPSLSISFLTPNQLQISWPSNAVGFQLTLTTNLESPNWQPVAQSPAASSDKLFVIYPAASSRAYFRLAANSANCAFHSTPAVINSGGSSTLSWCPVAGTTYHISPGGGGAVSGGSVSVSPTSTTVYSLTSSNASGVVTNFTTVVVNPCGWLRVTNWDVTLDFSYALAPTTASYNFSINHQAHLTFHLTPQVGSTSSDAYYFGFATGGTASLNDREDDKTGPIVFTTTEVGSGSPLLIVSYLSLHVTCSTYDFSYNALLNMTETSAFGVTTGADGVGTGAIVSRPIAEVSGTISDSEQVPAQYPPGTSDYFTPSSDLGKAMFSTGTVTGATGGKASVSWSFTPVP